jgi:hypothetical protein
MVDRVPSPVDVSPTRKVFFNSGLNLLKYNNKSHFDKILGDDMVSSVTEENRVVEISWGRQQWMCVIDLNPNPSGMFSFMTNSAIILPVSGNVFFRYIAND